MRFYSAFLPRLSGHDVAVSPDPVLVEDGSVEIPVFAPVNTGPDMSPPLDEHGRFEFDPASWSASARANLLMWALRLAGHHAVINNRSGYRVLLRVQQ